MCFGVYCWVVFAFAFRKNELAMLTLLVGIGVIGIIEGVDNVLRLCRYVDNEKRKQK